MRILFVDGTTGFSPHRLASRPTGGILTSLTLIPQYLAKRGFDVSVMSMYSETETIDGVHYISDFVLCTDPDIVIFNRNAVNRHLTALYKNALRILWLHDIVDYRYFDDNGFTDVHQYVALSNYNVDSYCGFYDLQPDKFVVIPNGVDRRVFHPGEYEKRDRNLYLMASDPIKGLHPVEFTYQQLKRNNPDVRLIMYCSHKLHDGADTDGAQKAFARFKGIGIEVLDPVPQLELAAAMRRAWCLLMPNHYPEICSNLLLQAQACGLPVVASGIGSVPEFIRHEETGLITSTTPSDWFWWWKDFAEQACRLLIDRRLHRAISQESSRNVPSWDEIGMEWTRMLNEHAVVSKISA